MSKKILIVLILSLIIILGSIFSVSTKNKKEDTKIDKEQEKVCEFEIKKIYFEESDDPNAPLLKIEGIIGPVGFYKYKIHFPPQEKTQQGIGPIEAGRDEPCRDEKICKPLDPCKEFVIKEFVYRSYPDNVPEFGVRYFGKITFYLNDESEKIWEDEVDWKKFGTEDFKKEENAKPMTKVPMSVGEAVVSFPSKPQLPAWEEELQNQWVPPFAASVVWGYRVFVNHKFYGDFPAVYTPTRPTTYVLNDTQSVTISGFPPGIYHVEIYPLGIYYSPNLVTIDGRRYAFKKTGPTVFVWAWVDNKGNPTSDWQPLSEIPKDYQSLAWPGYFLIHRAVFSGDVQLKKGGGGGGGGLIQ